MGKELGDTDHGMAVSVIHRRGTESEVIAGSVFACDHGVIDVFRNKEDAESYFEPWIVEEGLQFFDGKGNRLLAEPNNEKYCITLKRLSEKDGGGPESLRRILIESCADWKIRPDNYEDLSLAEMVLWCAEHRVET